MPQSRLRSQPYAFGCFMVVVHWFLSRRHGGDEEARIEALAHPYTGHWRDPPRPRCKACSREWHVEQAHHFVKTAPLTDRSPRSAGAGAVNPGKQNAGFLEHFANGGDIERGGLRFTELRLAQSPVQRRRRLIETIYKLYVVIVHLAAREDIGVSQDVRQAMALQKKNFQAVRTITQHQDGRRRNGGGRSGASHLRGRALRGVDARAPGRDSRGTRRRNSEDGSAVAAVPRTPRHRTGGQRPVRAGRGPAGPRN